MEERGRKEGLVASLATYQLERGLDWGFMLTKGKCSYMCVFCGLGVSSG